MADQCESSEAGYSFQEEIELLEAIYIHELTVEGPEERPHSLSVLLHPSTGDEEHKQYVCLTLVIILTDKYPDTCPSVNIKAPRGLSEAHIDSILSNLRELAERSLGGPMLYELIEYAKESLTDNNIPSCACAICLCHFQDSDGFTRTECYHYFHCSCLVRFVDYSLRVRHKEDEQSEQVECPICRLPITYDLNALRESTAVEPEPEQDHYEPDKEMKKLQKKMAALYAQQQKKGGIIDVEQERNRFLIGISSPTAASPSSDPPSDGMDKVDGELAERLKEPVKPVRPVKRDGREAQEQGKKAGSSKKHQRRYRNTGTEGTGRRKETREASVCSNKTEVAMTAENKLRENDNARDAVLKSDRKSEKLTESKDKESILAVPFDSKPKADRKQNPEQGGDRERRERRSKQKSANKKDKPLSGVQRTSDEQKRFTDIGAGARRDRESTITKFRTSKEAGKESVGSSKSSEMRLSNDKVDKNREKKVRRPPPGIGEFHDGAGVCRNGDKPVKPPPGFERALNGTGGASSVRRCSRPPPGLEEQFRGAPPESNEPNKSVKNTDS